MRGYLEAGSFRSWIVRLTSARARALDERALLASARLGIAEGLLAGITTYADTSSSGTVLDALVQMSVRGISYQEVFGPHPDQCADAVRELRQRISHLVSRTSPLVRLGVSPHAPYTVSDDLYRAVARFAIEERLPLAVHIAESRDESRFVADAAGPFADGWAKRGIPLAPRAASPITLLHTTGVLATKALLIHCVQLTPRDVDLIVDAQCPVAHCPASNAKFGHGIAPLTELRTRGAVVALGTDSVASNNRMDLLDEGRLALLLSRAATGSSGPDARLALELATIGGARALGLDSEVGSLELGKAADLAAFRVDALRDEPIHDPTTALVFGAGGRRAAMVCVDGRELVRDGRLLASLEGDVTAVCEVGEHLARLVVEEPVGAGLDFSVVQAAGMNDFTQEESER